MRELMEKRNVAYADRPNAILSFLRAGFSIDDIVITKIDSCHYNMVSTKEAKAK